VKVRKMERRNKRRVRISQNIPRKCSRKRVSKVLTTQYRLLFVLHGLAMDTKQAEMELR
jgi:hypothetical protein